MIPAPSYLGLVHAWVVPSESTKGLSHVCVLHPKTGRVQCSCAGFRARQDCKHARAMDQLSSMLDEVLS